MVLHTLNRSSFGFDLAGLLRAAVPGDTLLLLEDGVYAALDDATLARFRDAGLTPKLLQADAAARGIDTKVPADVESVTYAGFVQLVCDTDKTVAWF